MPEPDNALLPRPRPWRLGLLTALRITFSLTALFAAYYLIPARDYRAGSDVPWLLVALAVFAVVVGIQVPIIVRSAHPILRATETLALAVPTFLLVFARAYLSASLSDPSSFTEVLDRTGALYFSVTCFATVGFGDIVADTNPMRLLVTAQMLLDLVVLGVVVRVLASAARRGVAERVRPLGVPEKGQAPRRS